MTRAEFMARLRRGLSALSSNSQADITADYETHFADAAAAGRTEEETAAALGDPDRLARELRAEYGLKAWEEKKSPRSATGAILALLGLGLVDVFIVSVLLFPLLSVFFAIAIVVVCAFVMGGVVMIGGPIIGYDGGAGVAFLAGLGLVGLSTCIGALTVMASVALVNLSVWYARLHFRLLKPAIDQV
ncbi:MAG: DUF1700 domain-containing protein [Caulobacter sp.]|nr:DUF1700 domain-containing protein [Caulobacter sp.]